MKVQIFYLLMWRILRSHFQHLYEYPHYQCGSVHINFEGEVGFEPTMDLRHQINSLDFSASKATHPYFNF